VRTFSPPANQYLKGITNRTLTESRNGHRSQEFRATVSLHLLLLACSCAIDLLRQAQETDTVLLFIAGHGFNDGPNDCFLPNCRQCSGLSAQR
jgi:hypothetical protein